jgi:very-short-patch-repair endonuclease
MPHPNPSPKGEGLKENSMVYLGKSIEKAMHFGAKAELFRLAQEMRNKPTNAEKCLWNQLRKLRNVGYPFRRQHPIDFYIADFYCHELKLVIEVDGEIHLSEEVLKHDDGRTGELERLGVKVIRFTNEEVLNNPDQILTQIKDYIAELSSPSR